MTLIFRKLDAQLGEMGQALAERERERLEELDEMRRLLLKYAGDYEAKLIAEFDACLPEDPPWKQ